MSSETTKTTTISAKHPDVEEPWAPVLRSNLLLLVSLNCTALVIDFGSQTMFLRGSDGEWLSAVFPGLPLFDEIKKIALPDPATGRGRFGLDFDEVTLLFDVKISGNECEIALHGGTQLDNALAIQASDLLQAQWQDNSQSVIEFVEGGVTPPVIRYKKNASLDNGSTRSSALMIVILVIVGSLAAVSAFLLYWLSSNDS